MEESRPEVRIGDRERREVDTRLQKAYADGVLTMVEYEERSAQAWAARTRSELTPLTADLPDPEPELAPAATTEVEVAPTKAPAKPAPSGLRRIAAGAGAVALAGAGVFGLLQVVTADDGFSAFGGRTVTVAAGDDRVELGFVFGGTRVIVPPDVNVRTEGIVLFGGTSCRQACDGTGTREVVVDASGAFGGVSILRQGEQVDEDFDRGRGGDDDSGDADDDDDDD